MGRDTAAAPSGTLCSFKNNLLSHCAITHSDSVHTVLADFTLFPHSVVSRNGLVFNQSNEPIVDVSFGSYGDPSVYTQSSRYASTSAFIQALGVWHERTADHWFLGRNSTLTGPSTVSSALEGPGTHLLAAPK